MRRPPPTREDVSALANLIALVTALLFTIATAVPMSVGRGDLEHWDWQYSATGKVCLSASFFFLLEFFVSRFCMRHLFVCLERALALVPSLLKPVEWHKR